MNKSDVIQKIFHCASPLAPKKSRGEAFAPTNIALCKYWGKRDLEINLPVTSSLSITLPTKGAKTIITNATANHDVVTLNGQALSSDTAFVKRLVAYLNLFRSNNLDFLTINIEMNLPVAAGLASSAAGFASLILALNDYCDWQLSERDLSILARLGSGSACRSFWPGFVLWEKGRQEDGMDSYAKFFAPAWENLCVGLLTFNDSQKPFSSRDAMQQTIVTSSLYDSWPQKVSHDLPLLKQAIQTKDFDLLGSLSESNALSMHATMLAAWPPICYTLPETLAAMHQVWQLRKEGIAIYFTQDAGPNLKLLFLKEDAVRIKHHFSNVEILPVLVNE